ncbi:MULTISPECIES: hypothetical protein [unclassified Tolypothrix]|uniref:hypothetical protein n=1 Tax=unclassified Tolypothrix TaxID=2649714 RepID=UPI0005EAACBB|nr:MULTISPECIES: hypothetical protein [unclassified Tolypothrix]EKF01296.1 hypothetical protein FDUTEX481_08177 [Tolypothrix sp. PCC 7601]UYD24718.1 hypothetical protein HGR01_25305 [Tolypothrix sp. PCC 7712]UYD33052.1 hypothetical protein HG267_29350 [Tolypothrix sp. PCC 7601]
MYPIYFSDRFERYEEAGGAEEAGEKFPLPITNYQLPMPNAQCPMPHSLIELT